MANPFPRKILFRFNWHAAKSNTEAISDFLNIVVQYSKNRQNQYVMRVVMPFRLCGEKPKFTSVNWTEKNELFDFDGKIKESEFLQFVQETTQFSISTAVTIAPLVRKEESSAPVVKHNAAEADQDEDEDEHTTETDPLKGEESKKSPLGKLTELWDGLKALSATEEFLQDLRSELRAQATQDNYPYFTESTNEDFLFPKVTIPAAKWERKWSPDFANRFFCDTVDPDDRCCVGMCCGPLYAAVWLASLFVGVTPLLQLVDSTATENGLATGLKFTPAGAVISAQGAFLGTKAGSEFFDSLQQKAGTSWAIVLYALICLFTLSVVNFFTSTLDLSERIGPSAKRKEEIVKAIKSTTPQSQERETKNVAKIAEKILELKKDNNPRLDHAAELMVGAKQESIRRALIQNHKQQLTT